MGNKDMRVGFPGLGSELKAARKQAGMSHRSVAEAIGVSWMSVLRWEQEKRTVPLPHLHQLESLYNVGEFVPDPDAVIKAFCYDLKTSFWRSDGGWTTNVVDCIDRIIDEK